MEILPAQAVRTLRPLHTYNIWVAGADPGGGGLGVVTPPALDHHFFFFSTNFLSICGLRHTGNVQQGGGVLVNVQEWVYFSIFRRADDVTRTMSKGVCACECPRVGVFVIFWRADDVTRTMSKGGGGCL